MDNILRVAKRLIPIEEIALVEPFVFNAEPPLKTERDLKSRIVLVNKASILCEATTEELADAHGFRFLAADQVATNPGVHFSVETFEPAPGFVPSRPFQSRLLWRDQGNNPQSRLVLAAPELALAVVVRGERDPNDTRAEPAASRPRGQGRPALSAVPSGTSL